MLKLLIKDVNAIEPRFGENGDLDFKKSFPTIVQYGHVKFYSLSLNLHLRKSVRYATMWVGLS